MIGYKSALALDPSNPQDYIRVLITLEIPSDAITNCGRSSVRVAETAKYRANKVKVLKIEAPGKTYTTAISGFYRNPLKYTVGNTIAVEDYDMDVETVCSTGIHFFLTKRPAELYGEPNLKDGLHQSWHDNGEKEREFTIVNREYEGVFQAWHANGQKYIECTYVNQQLEGLYQTWHETGEPWVTLTYVNGHVVRTPYSTY
jgi:hypothetical protein